MKASLCIEKKTHLLTYNNLSKNTKPVVNSDWGFQKMLEMAVNCFFRFLFSCQSFLYNGQRKCPIHIFANFAVDDVI